MTPARLFLAAFAFGCVLSGVALASDDPCNGYATIGEAVAIARDMGHTANDVAAAFIASTNGSATASDIEQLRAIIDMVFANAMLSPDEIYGKAYGLCWIATNN